METIVLSLRSVVLVCPISTVVGEVTPTPSTIWFPVSDTVVELPDAPAPTTNSTLIPPNSSAVDACYDPDSLTSSQVFNDFLPDGDTEGTYLAEYDVSSLIAAKNETIPVRARLRCVFVVASADFDLTPISVDVPLSTRIGSLPSILETTTLSLVLPLEASVL